MTCSRWQRMRNGTVLLSPAFFFADARRSLCRETRLTPTDTTSLTQLSSLLSLPLLAKAAAGAAAALEIWNQVPSFLSQFQNRRLRVEGMDRDMKKFQERTTALLEQLDEPDLGLGPDAAIKAVSVRLNKAQQIETQANMAQSSFMELGRQVLQAETKAEEAAAALELLCEGLPPSSSRVPFAMQR